MAGQVLRTARLRITMLTGNVPVACMRHAGNFIPPERERKKGTLQPLLTAVIYSRPYARSIKMLF